MKPSTLLPALLFSWTAAPVVSSQTVSPPEELFLSLDSDGTALVREVRSSALVEGSNHLRVYETSPKILPSTLHVRSLTDAAAVRLLDQSLWFEVLDVQRLLELEAGRNVRLQLIREFGSEEVEGRLLLPPTASSPAGEIPVPLFVETANGKIRVLEEVEINLDSLPEGQWNRVRLDWLLHSTRAGNQQLELNYRTGGLEFELGYSLRLSAEGDRADLLVIASIDNKTGHRFANTKMQFAVRATPDRPHQERGRSAPYLYPVDRPVTVEPRRTHQVSLAHGLGLGVVTAYALYPNSHPSSATYASVAVPVVHRHDLRNVAAAGLGKPLPPGPAEIYRIADDFRSHREARSRVEVSMPGEVLSIPGRPLPGISAHRQVDDSRPADGRTVRLDFHNERTVAVRVEVMEPLGLRETVRSDAHGVDLSRPGWAIVTVEVPARASLRASYSVIQE